MSIIKKNAVIALALAGLYGCNSGSGDSGSDDSGGSSPGDGSKPPVTISVKDASFSVPLSQEYYVNLARHVTTSDGSDFSLSNVTPLSQGDACRVLSTADKGFTVPADSTKVCDYRYTVVSGGESVTSSRLNMEGFSAITRVLTSEDPSESELYPLGLATLQDTDLSIDLVAEFESIGVSLEGFTLSTELVLPYGHGSKAVADTANNIVTFTPASGYQGVDRILYSLSDGESRVLMGIIDIAISSVPNGGLDVEKLIVFPDEVKTNQTVDIDVSPYVTTKDGDDYQLVYVEAFDATVKAKSLTDLSNKAFTFSTTKGGKHHVSFAVSDHNGAYAMGLMEVDVLQSPIWSDIYHDGLRFIAPLTKNKANELGVKYSAVLQDDEYSPPVDLARLSETEVASYCELVGGRTATFSEWSSLVSSTDIKVDHNWPTQHSYQVDKNGTPVEVWDSSYYENAYGDQGPMCVQVASLLPVPEQSKLKAIANGVDKATVAVKIKLPAEGGDPQGYVVAALLNPESSASLEQGTVETDKSGIAKFNIKSVKAETVSVTAIYDGQSVISNVFMVGDAATSNLTSRVTRNDGYYNTGSNEVEASLIDALGNPVSGEKVSFKAESDADMVRITPTRETSLEGAQKANIVWTGDVRDTSTTVPISASFTRPDGTLLSEISNVTFNKAPPVSTALPVCGHRPGLPLSTIPGGGINDNNPWNVASYCLKVAEAYSPFDTKKRWFTGSPSGLVVEQLGYKTSWSEVEPGRYYFGELHPNKDEGPQADWTPYALFSYRSKENEGLIDQAGSWCDHLSEMEFAGRTDWKVPSIDELDALYNYNYSGRDSFYTRYGWYSSSDGVWTSDLSREDENGKYFRTYSLEDGTTDGQTSTFGGLQTSCVSTF
ncbi:DUF1566 domain-containing protein [Vibrio kanaloae]|uniref:DUF1566 domain-containing protein n=1 Tax=Vibrio kanaloae TaxID=170673 RepID=A0A4V5R315_9VIBR|nr:DUF1566 domain-containing protein [Vibrio kanaloae]TKF23658.1 DUF1566 domain-containing protein [Vibrio kanaloae]